MSEPPAPPPSTGEQREGTTLVDAEHPEAGGFGNQRRWRAELVVLALVVLALPLGAFWGARHLAEMVAMRSSPSMDATLGRPTWESLQVSGQRCASERAERYVRELVAPLLAALGPTPFEFQFMVGTSEEVNAFALPGGFVVVNRGLLAAAESGEEVAAVLGHELSHVTLRHSTKRLAGSLGASAALALILGMVDLGAPAYTLAHLSGLGYERDQEREADEVGLRLLLRAGISPIGMATFFERSSTSPSPPEIVSTHPDPGDRAERARRAAESFQPRVELPAPPDVSCD
jgi:beta-barrel assembly-enhancing protease